jgi:hypothetical protein
MRLTVKVWRMPQRSHCLTPVSTAKLKSFPETPRLQQKALPPQPLMRSLPAPQSSSVLSPQLAQLPLPAPQQDRERLYCC